MITNKDKVKIIKRIQRLLNSKYKTTTKMSELSEPMNVLTASALTPNPFSPEARKAIRAIKKACVDWNETRVTRLAEIAGHLTPFGIPANRAQNLKKVLSGLFDHFNAVNLDFIEKLDPNPIRNNLQKITELKTEDIDSLLLLTQGANLLPLNSHVTRIFQRVGILKEEASPTATQSLFKSALGRDATIGFYERVNTLGERICTPTKPNCAGCPLKLECLHGLLDLRLITTEEAQFPLPADIKRRKPIRPATKKKKKPAAKKAVKKTVKKTAKKAVKKTVQKVVKNTTKKSVKKPLTAKKQKSKKTK